MPDDIPMRNDSNGEDDAYKSESGMVLRREDAAVTRTGCAVPAGFWVLRDAAGGMMDWSKYRHDIAARFGLRLESGPKR